MRLRSVIFILTFFFAISFYAIGQPGSGGPGDRNIPLGGIEYLMFIGAGMGLTKLIRDKFKK